MTFLLPALKYHSAAKLGPNEVQFLVSAGEASGDLYASGVVSALSTIQPHATYYGCAGPRLQSVGVDPVIDASSLAVVGLAEVVGHLPRIYGQYRKLVHHARSHPPDAALLTDSPDFHLRVARHLKEMDVPIYYLVAPQVWAWRQGRVKLIRRLVDKLFCLFPFEEHWFRERGVDATYIGHPLARMVRVSKTFDEFVRQYELEPNGPLVSLLPGSRPGEVVRHLPVLLEAVALLRKRFRLSFVLPTPKGFQSSDALRTFRERMSTSSIQVIENDTWNCIGHSSLALAASGTVTVEAAVLGTPTVSFYKVNPLTWYGGRHLVRVPFFSMVNLIAQRRIIPELIQHDMTPEKLAAEATLLLTEQSLANEMRAGLNEVKNLLTTGEDPFRRAAELMSFPRETRPSTVSEVGSVSRETI
jgi:lipid-A-disaccharide synthase